MPPAARRAAREARPPGPSDRRTPAWSAGSRWVAGPGWRHPPVPGRDPAPSDIPRRSHGEFVDPRRRAKDHHDLFEHPRWAGSGRLAATFAPAGQNESTGTRDRPDRREERVELPRAAEAQVPDVAEAQRQDRETGAKVVGRGRVA